MSPNQPQRILWFLAAFVTLVPARDARAIGIPAQRIAAEATVAALPEPLHAFFVQRLDGVVERTVEPDSVWPGSARTRQRDDWHFLILDAAAPSGDWAERLQAARRFPARAREAQQLFREHDVKNGGCLPWELDRLVTELADAFRAQDSHAIVRCTGYVIHFCADAADPFATSSHCAHAPATYDGLGAPLGDPWFAHRDAAQRVGWELFRRNAERYSEQLAPQDVRFDLRVENVPFTTVACMLHSFEQLEQMVAADRAALEQMGLLRGGELDRAGLAARLDEYYALLDARLGAMCVQNLRRSVRLAVSLIVTAWTRAGSPDPLVAPPPDVVDVAGSVPANDPPQARPDTAQAAPPAASPAARFVASRNSKVYHCSDCPHARRIGDANRVEYASCAEAEADGRRPCRTCRPDSTQQDGTGR
ncbi:MAG TPA: hypothetical protein P5572_00550 [Phycisphaerae bacterium]|nr:hypothetical protein [Phycisphaerae bacterium]